jgi:hypothetical protein
MRPLALLHGEGCEIFIAVDHAAASIFLFSNTIPRRRRKRGAGVIDRKFTPDDWTPASFELF